MDTENPSVPTLQKASSHFPYRSLFLLTLIVSFAFGSISTLFITRKYQRSQNTTMQVVKGPSPTSATRPDQAQDFHLISSYPNIGAFNGFRGLTTWLNSDTRTDESIKGHVTLILYMVHYQTYSQKILPILKDLETKYRNDGLEVIAIQNSYLGVVEKGNEADNVMKTLSQNQFFPPTLLDLDNKTLSYAGPMENNLGWPAVAVVDKKGYVRYLHGGAGEYDKLYKAIDYVLSDATPTPPTLEELVQKSKDHILAQNNLLTIDHIEYNWVKDLSDTVHQVFITLAKKPRTKGIREAADIVQISVLFGYDTQKGWITGATQDATYCTLLFQSNVTDETRKSYAHDKCKQ